MIETLRRLRPGMVAVALIPFAGIGALRGQAPEAAWDITVPRGETREIAFTAEEGTWMSVDISPDGSWIVFDLLGHIYRTPATGGDAVALTQASGIAMNYHPRISPDGREIAFVSDRGGQDNLWVMNADGSYPRLIHGDVNSRIAEPTWMPDGRHIVVTKREKSPSGFYRTHDVLWMFPRDGGEGFEGVRLGVSGAATPARSGIWAGLDRAQWPSVSPDSRYLYFHSSIFAGNDRRLRRLDLKTGHLDNVTESKGGYLSCCGRPAYPLRLGEVAPEISPDGRWLAFARKLPGARTEYRGKEYIGRTALWLRDLETGAERIIMDPISNTLAEHHPSWHTRVLPGYSWAKDGESIVLSQGGKIRRLWVETGTVETIPFRAPVHRTISEMARGNRQIDDETFEARALRWPASSPNGTRLVFEAAGQLWTMQLPGGTPTPLTKPDPEAFQLTPAWSPDGRRITYVTSQDGVGGHVWMVDATPQAGSPEQLTQTPGTYMNPSWSPDGQSIVVSRWPWALTAIWGSGQWELIKVAARGGAESLVAGPGLPAKSTVGRNGRLFYLMNGRLMSLGAQGGDALEEATVGARAQGAVPSPDGRWLAIEYEEDVYLAPLPPAALGRGPVEIDLPGSARRLSVEGGRYPRWRNATTLEFVGANKYFAYDVDSERMDTVVVRLQIDRHVATGVIALTGARIITLDDRDVVEQGTILVRNGRITCVGECDTSGADRVLDVNGKTIMPGWIDVHAHHLAEDGAVGIIPQHRSTSARYLAWGVTTVHDPAAPPVHSFTIGEMIAAGRMVGPRSFSAGTHLTCGQWSPVREIRTFEDAQHHVNRLADLGAISIKDYKQCTRIQRTWLAEASRKRGVTLTSEGSDMEYLLGLIMTGHAGWEHPLQYVPVYSDVTTFFGMARAHYSAQTFISDYPTGNAIEYFFGGNDLWDDSKVLQWSPWQETATRRSFVKKPAREFMFPILAEAAADMKRAGAFVAMGAHGEQDGLGSHWETWGFAEGLTPMEALEAASLDGAHFLGLENEIGSVTVGKLADVVVLNTNPLDNIRNTTDIAYVMKAGRLYRADTLEEIWPQQRPYGIRPWLLDDVLRTDLRPDDYWDKRPRRKKSSQ